MLLQETIHQYRSQTKAALENDLLGAMHKTILWRLIDLRPRKHLERDALMSAHP